MLHRSFKPAKCKTALNLAKSRIKLMKNKKENQLRQLKREVAQLLESAQDQTARIRVEHVIREEKLIAAYEMIDIYCELIVMRLPIIESQKNCPLDLKEAITSLIFAAPRCGDIAELQDVRKHFTAKYGKEFATAAAELRPACGVSRTLIEKLSVNAPDGQMKVKVLTAIAEEHNIRWEPNWFKEENPVPSVDIPKVEVEHSVEGNKIQMQPLNFDIADDLEENRAHDKARPETSLQSHAHSNTNIVPPSSTSRPDFSESSSAKMMFNQLSGTAESAFAGGRQKWNMEFKDATAAAQAAAESAEMASLAARAAAELSIRSNMKNEDNRHNAGIGLQQNHVHVNSTSSGSFNQRSLRLQNQGDANRQGNMTEGGDATSSNQDYSRYGGQYETRKQDSTEIKNSRMHTRDSDSTSGSFNQRSPRLPNQCDASREGNMTVEGDATSSNKDYTRYEGQYETRKQYFTERENSRMHTRDSDSLKTEPNMLNSSNFQENDIESSENPFHDETEERKNQSSSFQSQSSAFGDEYGAFANLNYDKDKSDPGDGSFGRLSRNTADQEDWHVRSAYTSGEEDTTFKDYREGKRILESDNKYGFDSGNDVFVGMDHRTSGVDIDEKGNNTNAEVVFDESGSDEDDKSILNSEEEHDFSSPAEPTRLGSSLSQTNRYFEPDLSESFRRSPIYSKLTEPLPLTFDDSDGASSGSEKELQKEKRNPGVLSYDYQKPDEDNLELRSSYVERGTTDSFMSSKHLEENQNRFSGSISKNKYGSDDYGSSESTYKTSSAAVSTGFKSPSDNDLFDGGPQTSLQSLRISGSRLPVSEFISETQPSPEGGMELNLGSLPGGRRNRAHGRMPRGGLADVSSPSRSTEAFPSNTFGSSEKASTDEFHVPSSPIDNKQAPMKGSGLYTHYDSPDDDTEEVLVRKDSESAKGRYSMTNRIDGNVCKTSPKDRTIYSDDSSSEEDVPKPVSSKTFRGAGLSRRTKASSPRSVVSSHTSVAAKTGRSSSSYNTEVSSSRTTDLSSLDGQKFVTKLSKDDISSSSSVPEKPATPKSRTIPEASNLNEQAPSRENSTKNPSHVHPKLPDFETFTAHLQSLRKNRQ